MYVYEVKDVSKFYEYGIVGVKFPAVDRVSFNIGEEPRIYTIAGESGSGKTTLAKLLLNIIRPDRGVILYKGERNPKNLRREVQPIFQDPYDTFNIHEKVENYLIKTAKNILGLHDKERIKERIEEVLSFVGLSYDMIKGRRPREFSGGQLQRISIARSLIPKPKVLIADEPVSMLDASLRVNILNLFRRIRDEEKTIVIYITHDLATAYYISDYIFIMYRGNIVEHGPIQSVVDNPLHPYTQTLIKVLPDYRLRKAWFNMKLRPPSVELKEYLVEGCKYADRCPFATDKCLRSRPPMIEVEKGRYAACWLIEKT